MKKDEDSDDKDGWVNSPDPPPKKISTLELISKSLRPLIPTIRMGRMTTLPQNESVGLWSQTVGVAWAKPNTNLTLLL